MIRRKIERKKIRNFVHIYIYIYLNGGHIPLHVIKRGPNGKLGTCVGGNNTASNGAPVLRILDPIPEPW